MSMLDNQIRASMEELKSQDSSYFTSETLDMYDYSALLRIVTSLHPKHPSLSLETCEKHILKHTELFPILNTASVSKSFTKLADHPFIRILSNPNEDTIAEPGLPVKSNSNRSLQSAFEEHYVGNVHRYFIDALNAYSELNNKAGTVSKLYNKSICVIQSSGMGKSRLVDEAAKEVFAIPANLCEELPKGLEAYPPADEELRSYFERHEVLNLNECEVGGARGNRQKIYAAAVKNANDRRNLDTFLERRTDGLLGLNHSTKLDKLFGAMSRSAMNMIHVVANKSSQLKNNCFFYFDEAHTLIEPPQVIEGFRSRNPYHNLARASQGHFLIPPFTELPFDMFFRRVLQELEENNEPRSLVNACQTEVMSGMGRPLWYVHHKLWEEQQQLGGVRIGIAFNSTTAAAREAESRQVESHMRVVYTIPQHREYMHTGIALLGPEILKENFQKGLIARGEPGGLCGRLLVTIAHDIAVLQTSTKVLKPLKDPLVKFHHPVPGPDFLRALFSDRHHKTVLEATPVTNQKGKELETRFQNAFVCFSHFALAEDSNMFQAKSLQTALFRGMAIKAKDNEVSIDAVIPVHMGPITNPITTETTSAINLQFKNRKRSFECSVDRSITVPNFNLPVISIVFELGVKLAGEEHREPLVEAHHWDPPKTRDKKSDPHRDDHHYSFVARGCGPEAYNAVHKDAKNSYDAILAAGSLKDDFPRGKDFPPGKDGAYWELVQNLKPTFTATKCWSEWDEPKSEDHSSSSSLSGVQYRAEKATSSKANVNQPNNGPDFLSGQSAEEAKKRKRGRNVGPMREKR
ncbi:hypothetical protein OPQ81_008637 [Rhizoctonia solani]|nr:hypothetical protein OPQ81_008637 [Rhizoctonia solani]